MGSDKIVSSQLSHRLSAFSPDGRYFAVISSDSSIQVWDIKSGKNVANWKEEDQDSEFSCISCSNSGKKRKKDQKPLLIALGTKTGGITAVDLLAKKKIWSNYKIHNGEVVSLQFSQNGEIIYTAGTDGILCEINSENGELKDSFKASKKPINSLSVSHNEKLACVATKISRIFNLEDKSELVKIPSQNGSPQQIALTDRNVVCSYDNEEIQVFNLDPENKIITESLKLSMKNQPKLLQCNHFSNLDNTFVLSVSIKNVIYVWNLENMSQEPVPTEIKIGSKNGKKKTLCEIISAKLCGLSDDNKCASVIVSYRFMDSVKFEIIEIKSWGEEIFINSEENMHQTENVGEIKEKGKKRTSSQFDPEKEENREEINETDSEINPDEPTMEEKLASLDLKNVERENNLERETKVVNPPSADSVHILLKQALHADDHSLLLDCIYTRDEKVINKSVSLLNPADAIKLLRFFVIMSQSRGAVMVCVLPWLKSLISLKASSIVSHDSSLSLLNSLFQLIDSRVSTFGMALQLSTCIDFHFYSIGDDESEEQFEPPIIYEDKDSDDEEASRDSMDTDKEEEENGNYENAPDFSNGSEVMSD